jgi:eukaryotic-like serine/threonine-protein kinase
MQYCSQCSRTYPTDYLVCPRHNTPLEGKEELEVGMIVREKYKILDLIGDGAMGRVWLVEDLDFTYKKVLKAMKVPLPHLVTDPAYVQRFRDEAAKAGVLNHPNVVRTEHIDRTESGTPFLLMELVEGRSLRWWIDREPRLQWRHSVEIARQIALALEAAHAAGLVHCDIKPENVLAVSKTAPYPLKVTDFGLAKATSALTGGLTQSHGTTWGNDIVAGTLEYMSPEQAMSRGSVGPASDVYSLGVMLFEMLTGGKPFGRMDSIEAARSAHEGPPPTVRGPSELPVGLADLTTEMLTRDPGGRPSAAAVGTRLAAILEASRLVEPVPAPAASVAATVAATVAAPEIQHSRIPVPDEVRPRVTAPEAAEEKAKPRKPLLMLVALGLAALGVVVLAVGFLSSRHRAQPPPAEASFAPSPSQAVTPGTAPVASEFKPLVPADANPQPAPTNPPLALTNSSPAPTNPPPARPPADRHKQPDKQPDKPPGPAPAPQDAESLVRLGGNQLANREREAARESFGKAARLGNAQSMVLLGAMFSEDQNYSDAAKMFRQAADLGNRRGMFLLGVLYETGKGIPLSLENAAQWYESASRLGEKDSAYRLGYMYERGVGGMPKDLQKARDLYRRAGTPEASGRLAIISPRVP